MTVKSARLSFSEFIAWNFDIGDWLGLPDPLYHVIPYFLRICKITVVSETSGGKFAYCTRGEHPGVGVPCTGFFKICDDTNVPDQDMVHPCMVDVRYLKLYHTHYGKDDNIGDLSNVDSSKAIFLKRRKGLRDYR